MFGSKKKKGRISNNGADNHSTEDDNTPPPLDDLKMQDLSDNLNQQEGSGSGSSFSDFGEDEEGVENLQEAAAKQTRESLAKEETRAVSCLRYVVLTVLLATAVGVSLATFFYSRGVERESFEAEFEGVAAMTLRSFVEAFEHKMAAMDVLATGITSSALQSGEAFPNVTVPNWEVKGGQLRTQTDGIYSFFLPLVTDETRAGYEAYTKQMQMQLIQGYMAEESMRQYQDKVYGIEKEETEATDAAAEEATAEAEAATETTHEHEEEVEDHKHEEGEEDHEHRRLHAAPPEIHPQIHEGIWGLNLYNGSWIEPEGTGPYLPLWHMSPIIPMPGLLNYNFLAYYDLAPMMRQTLNTGKAALSYIQTNHTGSNTADLIRAFMTLNQYRHDNVAYQEDPLTQVTYPVFDNLSLWSRKTSGMVITTIFWRLLFADILPESVKGVVCVLSNTLGESVTYQIDGKEVLFLGTGDRHDDKYDEMASWRDIADYLEERAGPRTEAYTKVGLDAGYTDYTLHVYPSKTMEDTYITTDPIIYAVIVAFIFVFTSLVFLTYDWLVEKRQKKVMDKAVKSTAVVTSLFPAAVHDRLFGESQNDNDPSKEMEVWKAVSRELTLQREPTVADLMRSSRNQENKPDLSTLSAPVKRKKGRPIADKFPAVTVLFADLAGFTKWSSTREPEHVFILLETLYGAFDKIALKRHVFKVETIGDCYMACTGLPNPQADHAVRMVKFARDSMARMGRLTEELSVSLGSDTKELMMRVGLHSGPVTAGVLRGDKGRFQLFGDTVNTASRMESNGIKGRIHVSESTAANLPEKWLTMREDKIVAKGKGEMTTYFVTPGMGGRSSLNSMNFDSVSLGTGKSDGTGRSDGTGKMEDDTIRDIDASMGASTRRGSNGPAMVDGSFYHDYGEPQQHQRRAKPVQQEAQTRASGLLAVGLSWAEALGITDEIEV